jgi:hypothetical protein
MSSPAMLLLHAAHVAIRFSENERNIFKMRQDIYSSLSHSHAGTMARTPTCEKCRLVALSITVVGVLVVVFVILLDTPSHADSVLQAVQRCAAVPVVNFVGRNMSLTPEVNAVGLPSNVIPVTTEGDFLTVVRSHMEPVAVRVLRDSALDKVAVYGNAMRDEPVVTRTTLREFHQADVLWMKATAHESADDIVQCVLHKLGLQLASFSSGLHPSQHGGILVEYFVDYKGTPLEIATGGDGANGSEGVSFGVDRLRLLCVR